MPSPLKRIPGLFSAPNLTGLTAVLALAISGLIFQGSLRDLLATPGWFVAGVLLSELLFVPRITVLLASGILFSPLYGALYTITGDLLAAALVFALGRASFGRALGPRILSMKKIAPLTHLTRGPKSAALLATLRVLPFSHYSSVSLMGGTLGVPFVYFMVGTLLGNIPTALLYPFAARGVVTINPQMVTLALGVLIITILLAALGLHKLSRRIHEKT